MKTLNLANYDVQVKKVVDGTAVMVSEPYEVRDTLIAILFNQRQNLSARHVLDQDDLARKVRDCVGDDLVLEDADFAKVKQAVEAQTGYGQYDVELVRRVLSVT